MPRAKYRASFPLGSITTGTLKTDDLLNALADAIKLLIAYGYASRREADKVLKEITHALEDRCAGCGLYFAPNRPLYAISLGDKQCKDCYVSQPGDEDTERHDGLPHALAKIAMESAATHLADTFLQAESFIQDACPAYVYYATTKDNETGFWFDRERFAEDRQTGELVEHGKQARGYVGYTAEVNDHGNVTLWYVARGRTVREVWSIV